MTAKTIPAYEAMALDIKAMGVEVVFGLLSDDTAMFVASLDSAGVRFHGARHESNAVGMAEGYASASGKLGIAILGRGPATANALHGATYAQRSGSRVLIICGEATTHLAPNGFGPDNKTYNSMAALQASGFQPFVGTSPHSVRQVLADAVAATRRGAQVLLLPVNVQQGMLEIGSTEPVVEPARALKPEIPRAAAIAAASALLQTSRRPLILAGAGAFRSGAKEALIALAEHLGAALATTLKSKDLFRGHPMDCGIVGSFSNGGGRRLTEQADCILVFGAGLNQRTTAKGTSLPMEVPLIHVDRLRGNIGRWLHADVAVVGDVKLAAEALLESVPARDAGDKEFHRPSFKGWLQTFSLDSDFNATHTPRTVDPRTVALALDRMLPADRNLVYDSGNFLQVAPYISVPDPSRIKQAGDFSSIGMGFGVAIGHAISSPERPTLFVVGDGGFLMTMTELEAVGRANIPLVVAVMNDCAYGAEVHFLKMHNMPVAMSVFPDVDFAPVAEPFGFETATVRTLDDLNALAPLLADPQGPILIDFKINGAIIAPFLLDGEPGRGL